MAAFLPCSDLRRSEGLQAQPAQEGGIVPQGVGRHRRPPPPPRPLAQLPVGEGGRGDDQPGEDPEGHPHPSDAQEGGTKEGGEKRTGDQQLWEVSGGCEDHQGHTAEADGLDDWDKHVSERHVLPGLMFTKIPRLIQSFSLGLSI